MENLEEKQFASKKSFHKIGKNAVLWCILKILRQIENTHFWEALSI